jgi:hypothetical protein
MLGDKDFEKWILCELTGYSQSTMAETDVVPEYRIIPIRDLDLYNRQLLIEDPDLAFVCQSGSLPLWCPRIGSLREERRYDERPVLCRSP